MIKFFRKIRFEMMDQSKIGKYFKYAFGEIILVVIGILIAIQINNSNQKRLDREALEGYLNSIAQNIESDLKKAEKINETRLELFPRISLVPRIIAPEYSQTLQEVYGQDITPDFPYSVDNLDFMSQTINDAWKKYYLTPNLSGFESLKSSGYLGQLQGTDLEKLLFDYYNLLDELTTLENNYNESLQSSFDDFVNASLAGSVPFFSTGTRDWNAELDGKFYPMVDEIINHPTLIPVFFWPYELIEKYENLLRRGQALQKMILSGEKDFTEEINQTLALVFDEYSEEPYPKVIRHGFDTGYYGFATASAYNDQGVNMQYLGTHTIVQFIEQPWAVAYWYVGNGVVDPNRVKDYSKFKTLRLKLKGVLGGEKIAISIKDKSNPTDGSETKVPLTLTNQWNIYDIPLSSFAPTQIEELFLVTSIIVENQACTIEVESIEFL
ncbi:hypothetical protein ACFOSV_05960 [Algoriphagus namhaensis]|uniref:CBM11 domain-containing protein n=1 Tax=Algoriphagus namhaensis TaxID=915353 RepID=A0ABV8APP0_9BACT